MLGPALVFSCYWNTAFVYVFAELLGGLCAAITILPLYGFGNFGSLFDTRIFGWLGLSVPEHFQVHVLPCLLSPDLHKDASTPLVLVKRLSSELHAQAGSPVVCKLQS